MMKQHFQNTTTCIQANAINERIINIFKMEPILSLDESLSKHDCIELQEPQRVQITTS